MAPTLKDIVGRCEALFEDLHFNAVKQWKAARPRRCRLPRPKRWSVLPRSFVHYPLSQTASFPGAVLARVKRDVSHAPVRTPLDGLCTNSGLTCLS